VCSGCRGPYSAGHEISGKFSFPEVCLVHGPVISGIGSAALFMQFTERCRHCAEFELDSKVENVCRRSEVIGRRHQLARRDGSGTWAHQNSTQGMQDQLLDAFQPDEHDNERTYWPT